MERGELGGGVDRARPPVAERQPVELRERGEEVRRERAERLGPLLVRRPHPPPGVVDGVVPAPEDPVVRGQPGVVELVGQVTEPLPVGPADRGELLGAQRLGHQHVVVDRHRQQPGPAQQRREDVRRERDPLAGDRAVRRPHRDRAARTRVERGHPRALVDLDPELGRRPGPAPWRASRGAPARSRRGSTRRPGRAGCRPRRGSRRRPGSAATSWSQATWCSSTATLRVPVRSNWQSSPSSRTSASNASRFCVPSRSSDVVLVGPAGAAVLLAVGEAGLAEAAVAARRRPPDGVGLEQHHPRAGVAALREHRGPQPAVAAADHGQVGGRPARRAGGTSSCSRVSSSQKTACRDGANAASTAAAGGAWRS